jgi:protein-tyrosine phosphatase
MKPDLFWIPGPWAGKLAVMTRPRGGDWIEEEIAAWSRAQVDVVVSLLEWDEAEQLDLSREGKLAAESGVQFISFPIPDRGVPGSTTEALEMLARVAAAVESGKNVAIHCRQGIGRSGLIAAALLVRSGLAADEAIETVSKARGIAIPETPAQSAWIRNVPVQQLTQLRSAT